MKRLVCSILGLCLAMFPLVAFAGGSCSQTLKCFGAGELCRLTATCTASTVDGNFTNVSSTSVSATNLTTLSGKLLFFLRANPGSPAPTDNWTVTFSDAHGDILGGNGANMDSNDTTTRLPKLDSAAGLYGTAPWSTSLVIGLSGNSVASAPIVMEFWFVKE